MPAILLVTAVCGESGLSIAACDGFLTEPGRGRYGKEFPLRKKEQRVRPGTVGRRGTVSIQKPDV